jgi:hypothetical protein
LFAPDNSEKLECRQSIFLDGAEHEEAPATKKRLLNLLLALDLFLF